MGSGQEVNKVLPGQPCLAASVVDTLWGDTSQPHVRPVGEHSQAGLIRSDTRGYSLL